MSLQYYKYRLPFKHALTTTKGVFKERKGIILEFSVDGLSFYGEAAPLPGFSGEALEEIELSLSNHKQKLRELLNSPDPVGGLSRLYETENIPPSLQFGIDTLAYQVLSHRKDTTLQDLLFSTFEDSIPVNALGNLLSEQLTRQIDQFVADGYETVKFKIGLDFEQEITQLKKVQSQYPDLKIRLDANQQWSLEEAIARSARLEKIVIQYCEEPLSDPSPANFEALAQQTQLPLALDESINKVSFWPNLLPFTSFTIIKPMLIGSFTKNLETKSLANSHNNKVVYTTSLESSVGRQATALLASGSNSSTIAHGLATGRLLAKDVHSDDSYISEGKYNVQPFLYQLQIDSNKLQHVSSRLL